MLQTVRSSDSDLRPPTSAGASEEKAMKVRVSGPTRRGFGRALTLRACSVHRGRESSPGGAGSR